MRCPKCGVPDTKVLDSRFVETDDTIRRRRECDVCEYRFTTYERVEKSSFFVLKKDGTREPFDRSKIERGIWTACTKRPVAIEKINTLLSSLEQEWSLIKDITTKQIGEDVMKALKEIDEIAYVRFASVYNSFNNVNEFKKLLETLK